MQKKKAAYQLSDWRDVSDGVSPIVLTTVPASSLNERNPAERPFVPAVKIDTMSFKAGASMKRRKTTSAAKTRARKTRRPRRARAALPKNNSDLQKKNEALKRELREAREQQTATSEILKVISSSPGELGPVFEAMLGNAVRICSAKFGNLWLRDGDLFRVVATHGVSPAYRQMLMREAIRPGPDTGLGMLMKSKRFVQIEDITKGKAYAERDPLRVATVEIAGGRTLVEVPLLKDNELIGSINIYRQEVRPFTEKQIELVQNFAAQAVIAIENTRLLNELRQRTDDLSESLEQQTATSEILSVISGSPTDVQPTLDAIVKTAVSLCDSYDAVILLREGDYLTITAHHGPMALDFKGAPLSRDWVAGRTVIDQVPVHVADLTAETAEFSLGAKISARLKQRTVLGLPLLREEQAIGCLFLRRTDVRPFTDKQIALLQTFAAQAVIAIENTRLFGQLRQRTDDLGEALEQQTATSEVLEVISSSPGELDLVFDAILEKATQICEATFGTLYRPEKDGFRIVAMHGAPPAFIEERRRNPTVFPGPTPVFGRATLTKQAAQIADIRNEADPNAKSGTTGAQLFDLAGARSVVAVPMVRDDEIAGAMLIYRQEVRPFSAKQLEILQSFAAQAVIAIENTRLLNELRQRTEDLSEALDQQTATSEVLKVISSSPGDLEPVFNAVLENATRICEAKFGILFRYEGDETFTTSALFNAPAALAEARRRDVLFRPAPNTAIGRMRLTKQSVHVADMLAEPGYFDPPPGYSKPQIAMVANARTVVSAPMLKNDELVGAIVIYRQEVRPFSDKQIELVQNFAAQAVIAIENTRLLNELRQRTDDLSEALEQQTATSEVLQVISSSPGELEPVFEAILANATRICDAGFGNLWLREEDGFRAASTYGSSPEYRAQLRKRLRPTPGTLVARVIETMQPVQMDDMSKSRAYLDGDPVVVASVDIAGTRTLVSVPMVKDDELIGVIAIYRQEVRPFTDKQIQLLQGFAAQAVIAIENARLLSELRQRTVELEDKGRELAEASQHKSQFLANMSHELRTPLNAILGYTELIIDGIYGETPEKAQAVLKRVESNGRHLLGLINDVLDLSKIEAGQLKLALADYSIKDVIHNVVSAVEPLATKKKLNFKTDVQADIPAGRGDEQKLTQVLLNLTGNAIKFTDAGEVAIKVTATNGSYTVAIHDTGPGISTADQDKLFQQFQQADNSITKSKGGTGLGLAISKKIIELHGGTISVRSCVGQGSTFAFTLPITVERQVMPS